ncbi:MAG: hypothetical protein L6R38_006373 [Xanthoria sp. 2 TBL-2021]|nr:MAG: hypothetical protein L6R38_006373 [Xanthoria sp. 2 TBL-2021]
MLSITDKSPATTSTNPPTPTSPPQNSATRIRDNQRRSRARRKEYILELEAKVRGYEQDGVTASTEIQAAARKVVAENEVLREEVKRLREENKKLRMGSGLGDGVSEGQDDSNNGREVGDAHERGAVTPSSSSQKRKRISERDDNDGKGEESKRRTQYSSTTGSHGEYTNSPNYHHPSTEMTLAVPPTTFPQHTSTSPTSPASSSSPNFAFHPTHPTASIGTAYPSPPTSSQYKHAHPLYPPLPPPRQQQTTQPFSYSSSPSDPYPASSQSHPHPQLPPAATRNEDTDADPDTSSCHLAAQIITSMRSDISCEQVRQELGCTEKEECKVGNSRLLDVMGRFA